VSSDARDEAITRPAPGARIDVDVRLSRELPAWVVSHRHPINSWSLCYGYNYVERPSDDRIKPPCRRLAADVRTNPRTGSGLELGLGFGAR